MLEKVDLEIGIYRILSEEKGPSQNELFKELVEYAKKIKEKHDLVLKVDKANLSRKLKALEESQVIFHKSKKMSNRDQIMYSYFIKADLNAFENIMRHLARNIDNAIDISPLNVRGRRKFLAIKDKKPRPLTVNGICGFISSFLKSQYVINLIKAYDFKFVYLTFKKIELYDYCGLEEFIEHARRLIHDGSINNLEELGPEFLSESESWREAKESIVAMLQKQI
jgi:hypothetical protein